MQTPHEPQANGSTLKSLMAKCRYLNTAERTWLYFVSNVPSTVITKRQYKDQTRIVFFFFKYLQALNTEHKHTVTLAVMKRMYSKINNNYVHHTEVLFSHHLLFRYCIYILSPFFSIL